MTEQTSIPVQNYLSRLDAALAGVDADVRAEIVDGIREELAGLDERAAEARIGQMDDPALIAAEARAAMPPATPAAPVAEPVPGRTFSLVAVLVLIVGTFIVPVIGPLVGLVWVSMATAWTRREKIVAWLRPLAAGVIVVAIVVVSSQLAQDAPSGSNAPSLFFAFVGRWHVAVLAMFIILPIEGIVLLARAHRRGWRRPMPAVDVSTTRRRP